MPYLLQSIVVTIAFLVVVGTVGRRAIALRCEWEPSRMRWTERMGAAVEEVIEEKVKEKVKQKVNEKFEKGDLQGGREVHQALL